MKILSLFDGMACGYIAFKELGIPIDRYVAYETDKYAVKTSQHNFPDIEHCGDVFKGDFTKYQNFDFLCGGSPCTYWSIAQKNYRETEASGMGWELFQQYVRALREAKPKYFLYENNKSMSKSIYESISETFGFEPIMINASLVSAQNRQRYYWCGIRQQDGTYKKADIQQPKDRGLLLRDILEDGLVPKEKSYVLKYQAGNARDYLKKHHTDVKFEPVAVEEQLQGRIKGNNRVLEARKDGKSACLTSVAGRRLVAEPVILNIPHGFNKGGVSCDGKSINITANGGGQGGKTGLYAIPIEFAGGIPTKAISQAGGKTYTVYEVKDGKITIKDIQYPIKLADGYYIIRKLTVLECMRLQTVPEWFDFSCVSNTQAYKMLGNGWCIEVIKHLVDGLRSDKTEKTYKQMNFDI